MNRSSHTYEWVALGRSGLFCVQIRLFWVLYLQSQNNESVLLFKTKDLLPCMCHITNMNTSSHTYEWVASGRSGLFCVQIRLLCKDIILVCRDTGPFCRHPRPSCKNTGLFCGHNSNFVGDVGHFFFFFLRRSRAHLWRYRAFYINIPPSTFLALPWPPLRMDLSEYRVVSAEM